MSIPSLFFRTAILLAIAGILLGIFMGINQDFRLAHMHAHLNLLGWVSFFIFGGDWAERTLGHADEVRRPERSRRSSRSARCCCSAASSCSR